MSIKALASGTLNIHQKGFCIVTFNMVHFRDKNDTHENESLLPPGVTSFLLSLTTLVNPGSRQKAAISVKYSHLSLYVCFVMEDFPPEFQWILNELMPHDVAGEAATES